MFTLNRLTHYVRQNKSVEIKCIENKQTEVETLNHNHLIGTHVADSSAPTAENIYVY